MSYEKGDRVKIISGPDAGVVGEIFWWGPSRYGEGMRAGVTGDDEQKYWADEAELGGPDDDIVETEPETKVPGDPFSRGDHVVVLEGDHEGKEGEIFWWGRSKYGARMRAGVQTADGEKIWVGDHEIEHPEPK